MHDFPLITDLALILIAAGITSVICRKFKLPILLGYIIAGVLTGPHVSLLPNVHDMQNIETWSEIGVIFLLFALGLEFNFKSLIKVGKTGGITVAFIVFGMMFATISVGHFLDWSLNTSIFMGGILCISSTMVIVKAFEELNLKGKHFTNIVYGVEIMEDIVGIFLMVILSTIAISNGGDGGGLVQKISTTSMRVVFFLVLWFVGGIFIVPTLLRKLKKYLDDEILMTISLALCLGMVMLADRSNLSTALGAFTIGSILGATTEAQRIEHLMTPIKNLFGAIFFVSVGMMVVPGSILEHWPTLLLLLAIELLINPILGTIGVFVSGKSLHDALNSGACFGQIGEFSFIIAKLGVSLAVLDEFTYPIVITISAITMITTPYVMRFSDKIVEPISRLLPERMKYRVEGERISKGKAPSKRSVMIKHFIAETFILSMILLGVMTFMHGFIEPNLRAFISAHWASWNAAFASQTICIVITLIGMTPFLSALILRRTKLNRAFMVVLLRGGGENILLTLQIIRVIVAACFIAIALYMGSPFEPWWIDAIIGVALLIVVMRFELVFKNYVRLERQFVLNYNEVELNEQENGSQKDDTESLDSLTELPAVNWFSSDFLVGTYRIDEDSPFKDKSLIDLNLRAEHNLFIIRIERDDAIDVNIPTGQEVLRVGDAIDIVGNAADLAALERAPYDIPAKEIHKRSIRQFSREMQERRSSAANLRCLCIPIHQNSGFAGKTLRTSGIGRNTRCLVIGIETCGRVEMNPSLDMVFAPNSRLWVIGESDDLAALLEDNLTSGKTEPQEGATASA